MFFKIDVLKNFAIFTGKHLCWSLFYKIFKSSFFIEHLRWLLLQMFCFTLYFQQDVFGTLHLNIAFFILQPKTILIRFHSLSFVVLLVVICCTNCCHSLSFVVTRSHSPLLVTRCHSMYHSPVFLQTIKSSRRKRHFFHNISNKI